jgi:hypothetical protein
MAQHAPPAEILRARMTAEVAFVIAWQKGLQYKTAT